MWLRSHNHRDGQKFLTQRHQVAHKVWECKNRYQEKAKSIHDTVWRVKQVFAEWCDATLEPVPKKGGLSVCDNWRDISLLDVMVKLFARILNDRLQSVVEDSVADSQCGFRAGRGCVDMVFM